MKKVNLIYDQACYCLAKEYYHKNDPNWSYLLRYRYMLSKEEILVINIEKENCVIEIAYTGTIIIDWHGFKTEHLSISNMSRFLQKLNSFPREKVTQDSAVLTTLLLISEGYLNFYRPELNRKERRAYTKRTKCEGDIFKLCLIKPREFSSSYGMKTEVRQREHLRRGHYRHYKSGRVVFVEAYTAGDSTIGRITKDYKIKRILYARFK